MRTRIRESADQILQLIIFFLNETFPFIVLEPEPKLRVAAPVLFFYHRLEEILFKKIMIAEEFVKLFQFLIL